MFRRYDYGEEENLKRYGTNEPPLIDISQIRDVPIAVFGGKYDLWVPINDSLFIRNNLHPSVLKHYEEWEAGHQTFIVGKEATYLEKVAELIKEYSK